MKINDKELAELSFSKPTTEGRLHHKRLTGGFSQAGFKEKWFKLKANILFYFNISDIGKIHDQKPVGAIVLENTNVQYEMLSETPFAFSITFLDEVEKKHLFSARSEENVNIWVNALKQASYEYWRSHLILLQTKIKKLTGKDPLLMYPRNHGLEDASSQDKSFGKAQTTSQSSFHISIKHSSQEITPSDEFLRVDENYFSNGLDLIGSTFENTMMLENPPLRPARAERVNNSLNNININSSSRSNTHGNSSCGNLIEL